VPAGHHRSHSCAALARAGFGDESKVAVARAAGVRWGTRNRSRRSRDRHPDSHDSAQPVAAPRDTTAGIARRSRASEAPARYRATPAHCSVATDCLPVRGTRKTAGCAQDVASHTHGSGVRAMRAVSLAHHPGPRSRDRTPACDYSDCPPARACRVIWRGQAKNAGLAAPTGSDATYPVSPRDSERRWSPQPGAFAPSAPLAAVPSTAAPMAWLQDPRQVAPIQATFHRDVENPAPAPTSLRTAPRRRPTREEIEP
jgi:hypothetical protein